MHLDFARYLDGFAFTGRNSFGKFFRKGTAAEDLVGMPASEVQERGARGRRSLSIHLTLHRDHLALVLGGLFRGNHRDDRILGLQPARQHPTCR